MTRLTLTQQQAISELADVLYPMLPGSSGPFGNTGLTFPAAAARAGLEGLYPGGSKRPAIVAMLERTLQHHPAKFTDLMEEIVRTAITKKNDGPVTREKVVEINSIVRRVGFGSRQLNDSEFLSSLPRTEPAETAELDSLHHPTSEVLSALKSKMMEISTLSAQPRGYAFEKLLNELFGAWNLAPRSPFRITGEQIDGSFALHTNIYLIEARWRNVQASQSDLLAFAGKVEGKATWSRGLFVSYAGFSTDGLAAYAQGKPTRIICIDGIDLWRVLDAQLSLPEVLEAKARRAVETNEAFVSVAELFPGRV